MSCTARRFEGSIRRRVVHSRGGGGDVRKKKSRLSTQKPPKLEIKKTDRISCLEEKGV